MSAYFCKGFSWKTVLEMFLPGQMSRGTYKCLYLQRMHSEEKTDMEPQQERLNTCTNRSHSNKSHVTSYSAYVEADLRFTTHSLFY